MLVLTRRVEEVITIGDEITVKVLAINKHQVKLGIDAPRKTGVYREEIYRKIQEERKQKKRKDVTWFKKLIQICRGAG